MSEPILIKRYASRRLYNTQTSDYVTLDDIAEIIRSGNDVKIIDRASEEDITRQILLQIITEREMKGENVLPLNVLTDIVRSYNETAQSFVPDFLSQSFAALKDQQAKVFSDITSAMPKGLDPASVLQSMEGWQQTQQKYLEGLFGNWLHPQGGSQPDEAPVSNSNTTSESKDDIEAMKAQLAALQKKLDGL